MRDPDFRYYLITDRKQCHPRPLTEVVKQACREGIKAVQLREKDLGGRALFALAGELREITRRWEARLFINDRTDVALAVGADGVHCRETGVSPARIKNLQSSLVVGSSVHSIEASRRAEKEGADFLLFGPVFYTASKAKYGAPQGIEALQEVVEAAAVPVFAVGGITPERAPQCRSAGAYGVAGISSVMPADSVEQQVNRWRSILHTL
ncbi:thiamine-phosphate diphosphorylase [Fodinibius roseus]|uniref:Thiamine-phosphate synthase n=1 Tax=Fodinibius roseus TaxID=1194090 RepID=A0A1M5IIW4_9BACT|nr:thiamine phosphate synthase [Fodinibius roseus]SHG28242.1 thiamine-phosphate diphosphorylase [Fodinibius roseus]